jgi:ribosomal protein L7/L12
MTWWQLGIVVILLAIALSRRRREGAMGPPQQPGPSGQPPADAEVDALIVAGRTIEAIKVYRKLHGADLKDAKDAVDARARQLPGGS